MSSLNIEVALDKHLAEMDDCPDIDFDGTAYTPVIGTLYLRPTFIPATTQAATAGPTGDDVYNGRYQVDVFSPLRVGKGCARNMTDKIEARFNRASAPSFSGTVVRIVSATTIKSATVDGWLVTPVDIIYQSYNQSR